MNKKIIGILVCIIFIVTAVLPVGGMINYNKTQKESSNDTQECNQDIAIEYFDFECYESLNNMMTKSEEEILQEIDDMIDDITDIIYDLPDDAFINNPDQRKNAFSEKFDEVYELVAAENYEEAINKLLNDIRCKADGSLGGNPKNDWIIDPDAQVELCTMIDELITYIETLL